MIGLTVGRLAKRSGVNIQTIRYYERRGLLPAPPRSDSGYRYYPPEAVGRIRFIKGAQMVGFTLKEIRELLSLRVDPGKSAAEVRRRAEAKIMEIEVKMRALRRMKRALAKLVRACQGRGPAGGCPILDALAGSDRRGTKLREGERARSDDRRIL